MAWTWQGVAAALVMGLALHPASAGAQTHATPQRTRATANIIRGTDAVGSSLGMVAEFTFVDDGEQDLCSGTVVASNVILTAGHCAEDLTTGEVDAAGSYTVVTGTQSNDTPGQVSGVTQVIPDPHFDPSTLSGDAALLVLATPTTVTPVPLADSSDSALYDYGTETTIAGWGVVDDADNELPPDLQYGSDEVEGTPFCDQAADEFGTVYDPTSQLCAQDTPTNADGDCHGDSGGPILYADNGAWIEIGITSFGQANCDTTMPTFFTRTDALDAWIQSEIQANPPAAVTPPATVTPARSTAPVATSPAAAPTPPTTTGPATTITATRTAPRAGVYRGRTSQGKKIALTVNPAGTAVDDAIFRFRLTCPRHRHLTAGVAARVGWRLTTAHATGFADSFRNGSGARYRLTGTFSASGRATGTLRITDKTARYGSCTSGAVRWSAGT